MAVNTLIGTSGFAYQDWVGPFYPPELAKSRWLPFYAERFNFLELNVTHYRIQQHSSLQKMVANTPDDLCMVLKMHQSVSHPTQFASESTDLDRVIKQFCEALPGLGSRPLIGVLVQFPFRFHYTVNNRRYLSKVCDTLSNELKTTGAQVLVEFRNSEWESSAVAQGLTDRGAVKVAVDAPPLKGLPPPLAQQVLAAGMLYLRCHGRRTDQWWEGTNESRYAYRYSDQELGQLAEFISRPPSDEPPSGTLTPRPLTVVAFNNHFQARAARNAERLSQIVQTMQSQES